MRKIPSVASLCATALLCGCSPHFNWREFTSKDASYQVLFPDKPATASRIINLDGMQASMTMTAAEVGDIQFAVGQAEATDAAAATLGLVAMQAAMVRNIQGTVTRSASRAAPGRSTRDVEATGTRNGTPTRLVAHFEARGRNLYQVIVVGPTAALKPEPVEQFMTSFKALK